jgi:hypothetical protein
LRSDKLNAIEFLFRWIFLPVWEAKDADFLCIEPWCGVADSVNRNRHLEKKEGIISLKPHKLLHGVYHRVLLTFEMSNELHLSVTGSGHSKTKKNRSREKLDLNKYTRLI